MQNLATADAIPMKVTFGDGAGAIEYPYIEFRTVRKGEEEFEVASVPGSPVEISIVSSLAGGGGSVSFTKEFRGSSPAEMQKYLRACHAMSTSKKITLFELRREVPICFRNSKTETPNYLDKLTRFVDDAETVSRHYNVPLRFPEVLAQDDFATVAFLKELIQGVELSIPEITATTVRTADCPLLGPLCMEGRLSMYAPELPWQVQVFKAPFHTGPVEICIEKARVRNPEDCQEFLCKAAVGTSLEITVEAISKMRFKSTLPKR
jgi:hypothetical protein